MKTKLQLLDEKISLRAEAEKMVNEAEKAQRRLNSTEMQKFNEIRHQMDECDKGIKAIDESLQKEHRNITVNSRENMKNFSILNAIRAKVDGTAFGENEAQVIENANKEMRAAGLGVQGFAIPLFGEERANELVAKTNSAGGYTIPTALQSMILPLYQADVLNAFSWMTGLTGNIEFPVMNAGSAAWADELAPAGAAGQTFGNVTFSPKRLTAKVVLSKQLIMQSNESIEAVIREDIGKAVAQKLMQTILGSAAGSATQPAGLFNGAATVTSIDYAALTAIEAQVENANAIGEGFILNPSIKASFKSTPKASGQGGFIFENGLVDGMPAYSTPACDGILYGQLSDYLVCQFGNGADIIVDPYTMADKAAVVVTINAYFDGGKKRNNTIVAKKIGS